ncbi:hypothetical protein KEM52_004286 [Ascosphaera acerosa]|nr:hypothetical protein KEM52_004286 [Ascosphaera acerosa]
MLSPLPPLVRAGTSCVLPAVATARHVHSRFASLSSAIGRGIRQSQAAKGQFEGGIEHKEGNRRDGHGTSGYRHVRSRKGVGRWADEEFAERPLKRESKGRKVDERGSSRSSSWKWRRSGSDERVKGDHWSPASHRSGEMGVNGWNDVDGRAPRKQRRADESDDDQGSRVSPRQALRASESVTQARISELEKELSRLEAQMKAPQSRAPSQRHARSRPATTQAPRRLAEVYYPLNPVKLVAPRRIIYSSPGTEFIYGSSAVLAALRCDRRRFYKLYIYQPDGAYSHTDDVERRVSILRAIQKQGLRRNAEVVEVSGNWMQYLTRLSGGRPHNGVVLEASLLPQPPLLALRRHADPSNTHFEVQLAQQQADEAAVNGTEERVARFFHAHDTDILGSATGKVERYPMVVVLDQIKDPGNLGAILRSAYYFGVDAVVLSRSCPPITPVVLKASAGAAENMPIFRVSNLHSFVQESRQNGWKFYAADAPELSEGQSPDTRQGRNYQPEKQRYANSSTKESLLSSSVGRVLYESPCALVLGSEDKGLDARIMGVMDDRVSIVSALTRSAADDGASVDSLNVSVAAALLCQSFLGDSAIVQQAQPIGPPLTVPEMVNQRMRQESAVTAEKGGSRLF